MAAYLVLGVCVSSVLSLPVQFPQLEDGGAVLVRHERDGGAHGHGHGGRRGQRQQGHQNQREQEEEEDREGRQTGGTGLALGVLNSPPSEDGFYNFKYEKWLKTLISMGV